MTQSPSRFNLSHALRWRVLLASLAIALGTCAPVAAHDGPQHVIDALTMQMATSGQTAERLYKRACEYRTLGQLDRAQRDLRQVLQHDPQHRAATIELAQVLLAARKNIEAIAVVDDALRQASSPGERAPLRMIRCDAMLAAGQTERALAECRQACRENPTEVEWLLRRSQLEALLGRHAERIAELAAAEKQMAGGVLHIEWIDALLDAGRASEAIAPIETELADSRLQSSWLIRRARARKLLGKSTAAAADLRRAIAEINGRIHPERPDLSLIADRGLAYALAGEFVMAERDLHAAQARQAEPWMLWRLQGALAARNVTKP